MKKYILLSAILLTLLNVSIFAQVQDTTLNMLIEKAINVSPKLKMLENKQKISELKVPQVSNLPDPVLTLGMMNLPTSTFSLTQEPMTGKVVGLSQKVPFPGKLGTAEKMQSKDVEINQQEIDDQKNEIAKDVSDAYFDLRFAREAKHIAEKNLKILQDISKIVRTKYSVSTASQQNLIQVDVEITKLSDKIEELKGKESSALATLNALLLQGPETEIPTAAVPALPNENIIYNDIVKSAEQNRPYLKGIKTAEDKAALMEKLSNYDFYPNFNFSVQYSQRDRIAKTNTPLDDFLSFMVGVNLPLNYGGKTSSKVEEAKVMQKLYSDQYKAALQMLDKNFGVSLAKLKEYRQREKLIREALLPQAQQSLDAAMANYQVGKIDFINVLDAQNKLNDIETNLYNIRTKYFKEIAKIEFLAGTKVNNMQNGDTDE